MNTIPLFFYIFHKKQTRTRQATSQRDAEGVSRNERQIFTYKLILPIQEHVIYSEHTARCTSVSKMRLCLKGKHVYFGNAENAAKVR